MISNVRQQDRVLRQMGAMIAHELVKLLEFYFQGESLHAKTLNANLLAEGLAANQTP